MAKKTTGVTFRFTPDIKSLLDQAAKAEQRTRTNLIEVLLTKHCREKGLLSAAGALKKTAER